MLTEKVVRGLQQCCNQEKTIFGCTMLIFPKVGSMLQLEFGPCRCMEIKYIALALNFASTLGVCASFDLTAKTTFNFLSLFNSLVK